MFSVIISTYNRPWFLRRSITSVLEQTDCPSEILIIDSGTKPICSLVDSFRDRSKIKIRYIWEALPNVCLMRNLGAAQAHFPFLVFLDDDDYLDQNYLRTVYYVLQKTDSDLILNSIWKIKDHVLFPYKNAPQNLDVKTHLIKNNGCIGSNTCIRRKTYLDVGGYDATIPSCDDMDFAIRLAQMGGVKYYSLAARLSFYQSHYEPRQSMRPHPVLFKGPPRFFERYKKLMYDFEIVGFIDRCLLLWDISFALMENYIHKDLSFLRSGTMLNEAYRIEYFIASGYWGQVYKVKSILTGEVKTAKILFLKTDKNACRWSKGTIEVPSELLNRFTKQKGSKSNAFKDGAFFQEFSRFQKVYGACQLIETHGSLAIISDFFPGVALRHWLHRKELTKGNLSLLLENIKRAIEKVHRVGILHRDLHLNNILVAEDLTVKIVDFGMATETLDLKGALLWPPFPDRVEAENQIPPEFVGVEKTIQSSESDMYSYRYIKKHITLSL